MMDNQYNYYRPDSDENRGADNQQGFGAGPQQNPKAPKPKKGYAKRHNKDCIERKAYNIYQYSDI